MPFFRDTGFVVDYLNEGSFERRKGQKIVKPAESQLEKIKEKPAWLS